MIYLGIFIIVGILLVLWLRTKEPEEDKGKVSNQWLKENSYEKKP